MTRAAKKHVTLSPTAAYPIPASINRLIGSGAISGTALKLWLQLKMLSWRDGECNPTDSDLRALLGDMARESVRTAREELRRLHLLVEYRGSGGAGRTARWLIPLPAPAHLPGHVPLLALAEVRRAAEAFEAEHAAEERAASGDAQSAGQSGAIKELKKKEKKEEREKGEETALTDDATQAATVRPAGHAPATVAGAAAAESAPEGPAPGGPVSCEPAADEGDSGEPAEEGPFRFGPQPGTVEFECLELSAFFQHHGMYPSLAEKWAPRYLARMDRLQAMIWTLALRREADLYLQRRQYKDAATATGVWVEQVRKFCGPQPWALQQAVNELLCGAAPALNPPPQPPPARYCGPAGPVAAVLPAADPPGADPAPAEREEEALPEEAGPFLPLRGRPAPLREVWRSVLAVYRQRMTAALFNERLLGSTPAGLAEDGRVLIVAVRTAGDAEFLNRRMARLTRSIAAGLLGESYGIRFSKQEGDAP